MIRLQGIIALGAMLYGAAGLASDQAQVTIDSGTLVGVSSDAVNSFKGVPFAKPPVGQLRWKPPQVPDHWSTARDATKYQPPCTQPTDPDGKTPNGGGVWGKTSEDCLYLNVFGPANAKSAPVMVWLHGEGFAWLSYTAATDDAAVFGVTPALAKSVSLKNGPPPGAPRGSMAPN